MREAIEVGRSLVKNKLVKPVFRNVVFDNRSSLFRFNLAMDSGIQAARWCLSQEMVKVRAVQVEHLRMTTPRVESTLVFSTPLKYVFQLLESTYTLFKCFWVFESNINPHPYVKMEDRVKDVCSVVGRHTAACNALSVEHAAGMEKIEAAFTELRAQLVWTRCACLTLAVAVASLALAQAVPPTARRCRLNTSG